MSRKTGSVVSILTGIALTLLIAGCSSPSPAATRPPPPPAASSSGLASGPSTGVQSTGIDHVVIIVEENHSASGILGNSDAPYINQLAAKNALATNYKAVAHPSLPNYLALTSGTTAGITDDCDPGGACTANVPNITDAIVESGRTWKMYAESMPAPCTDRNSGTYGVRHNPFMYYPGVTNDQSSCRAHVVPLTQLSKDLKTASSLPDYSFISPNACNDMHDCSVATGDAWLSHQAEQILASPAFTTQKSLLVITWDEDDDNQDNTVATIFAGPAARQAYKSSTAYTHYSLLHTIESAWGLKPMTANDKNAPTMSDMLK